MPYSYLRGRPARIQIMTLAGRVHPIEPALVAAFVLAEQRDQSRNEDAKDHTAATHPLVIRLRNAGFRPLALIAGLVVASCNGAHGKMQSVQASFGDVVMTLDVTDDLVATPIAGGGLRLVRRDAGQSRRIYEITLLAAVGASPVPLDQARGTGEAAVRYGVDHFDGGSGGPEVTLIAERRCQDLPVRLRLNLQAEEGTTPDVDAVLDMLANARC